jgi:hypothetical protein
MVQKGVGWLLKDPYPKKPRETLEFLDGWRTRAPRLVLRLAAEKMNERDRRRLLTRHPSGVLRVDVLQCTTSGRLRV